MKVLAIGGFLIVAMTVALWKFTAVKAETPTAVANTTPVQINAGALSKDEFWAIVDHSALLEAEPDAQLLDLRHSLNGLTVDQIVDFERTFDNLMRQSYTWDLWGAAYLANGGASDDGFEYFRVWLISKGRRAFEAVAANPDRLAETLAPGNGGDLEFEEFAYVAREAWATKSGKDWNAMPVIANMAYDTKPTGVPFDEDPAGLAKRYPKLWVRFGR